MTLLRAGLRREQALPIRRRPSRRTRPRWSVAGPLTSLRGHSAPRAGAGAGAGAARCKAGGGESRQLASARGQMSFARGRAGQRLALDRSGATAASEGEPVPARGE